MFRIFLKKKLFSGKSEDRPLPVQERISRQRNRRLYQRYQVNQQHLTVLNEQDILVIRDISAKGFSSDVSIRAYRRFRLDDVYDARMRYLGELHDINIKVAWKHDKVVGFEIYNAHLETLQFLKRLLKPIQLANSLSRVDAAFMRESQEDKTWYHGDESTDLMIWRASDHRITAWQLITADQYVEWNSGIGYHTGVIRQDVNSKSGILKSTEELMVRDLNADRDRLRFAADFMMALPSDEKHEILDLIMKNPIS